MKYAMPGRDLPKVMANPTAQYTIAPMHMSSQFLIRMFTVFFDLRNTLCIRRVGEDIFESWVGDTSLPTSGGKE